MERAEKKGKARERCETNADKTRRKGKEGNGRQKMKKHEKMRINAVKVRRKGCW